MVAEEMCVPGYILGVPEVTGDVVTEAIVHLVPKNKRKSF